MHTTTIEELLQEWNARHDSFQIDNFITRLEGGRTLYGMLRQALRQLASGANSYLEAWCDLETLKIDIEVLGLPQGSEDTATYRKRQIERIRIRGRLGYQQRKLEMREGEVAQFYAQAIELKRRLGEIDDERREKLIQEMWVDRILHLGGLDILREGKVSAQIWETVASFPEDVKQRALIFLKDPEALKQIALSSPPEIKTKPNLAEARRYLDGIGIYRSSKSLSQEESTSKGFTLEHDPQQGKCIPS